MDPSSNGFSNEDQFNLDFNKHWNENRHAPITKTIKVPYPVKFIVDRPYPVYKQIVVSVPKPVPYPVPVWHIKKIAVPKPYPVLKYVNNYIPVYYQTYHQTWHWRQ